MFNEQFIIENTSISLKEKVSAFVQLSKPRLTFLVIFSAVMGYLLGSNNPSFLEIIALVTGGYLVTASSNAFNQILEKDHDSLMIRTKDRPLPKRLLSINEAYGFAIICGIAGLLVLFYFLNEFAGWLGAISIVMYVLMYTPLKRISPISVFVGAFPGAIPPMLGYIAAGQSFGFSAGLIFLCQFIWQFPHFWAIAWKLNDQYSKAGFKMLPIANKKSKINAFIILIYTVLTIPTSITLFYFDICGWIYLVIAIIMGIYFSIHAIRLFMYREDKHALKLMFASFIYLPVMQIIMVIDKI